MICWLSSLIASDRQICCGCRRWWTCSSSTPFLSFCCFRTLCFSPDSFPKSSACAWNYSMWRWSSGWSSTFLAHHRLRGLLSLGIPAFYVRARFLWWWFFYWNDVFFYPRTPSHLWSHSWCWGRVYFILFPAFCFSSRRCSSFGSHPNWVFCRDFWRVIVCCAWWCREFEFIGIYGYWYG